MSDPQDYRMLLAEALPALRSLEGCPLGHSDALLDSSLPPAYTACPNPFVADLLPPTSECPSVEEPFASDVSCGRTDPLYLAQIYHTKVPPQAIARYIEHYAPPGGLVFDGFCGSGMTGLAARLTGRRAILVDLSPAATALAANYCLPVDATAVRAGFEKVLQKLRESCTDLYLLPDGREIDYVIWSEVYTCPHCGAPSPFSDMGFDFTTRRPRRTIVCPACRRSIAATRLVRVLDDAGMTREVPVRLRCVGDREVEVGPGDHVGAAEPEGDIPYWYPRNTMMNRPPASDGWGDMWRRGYHSGIAHVADFYTRRTLHALAAALHFANLLDAPDEVRHFIRHTILNASLALTRMRRAYQGPLPLVLYFPRLRRECNVLRALGRRFRTATRLLEELPPCTPVAISTQSSTSLPNLPDECVDYIFTDPPFGQNIIYSEVNFLWESWMGVTTSQEPEAIVSRRQRKGVGEYRELMERCFTEFRRILKPGAWITVEFHNSDNEVWAAIQSAMQNAGFDVRDVRILDKRQLSFKQASTDNAVQKDLAISARKPNVSRVVAPSAPVEGGTEQEVWRFIHERLAELGEAGPPQERTAQMLFTRMVQRWLQRGWRLPMTAEAFYRGLKTRFAERDGLYGLP